MAEVLDAAPFAHPSEYEQGALEEVADAGVRCMVTCHHRQQAWGQPMGGGGGVAGTDLRYGPAPVRHMRTAAAALTELASLLTASTWAGTARPLHIRLSHIDHGGFLTVLLKVFPIPPLTWSDRSKDHPADRTAPQGSSDDPFAEGDPLVFGVVANHPVATQIEAGLAVCATLLARQQLVTSLSTEAMAEIDRLAQRADADAQVSVVDSVRMSGWRAAAEAIRARAVAAGLPLVVTYEPVLLDQRQLVLRAPVLRRVYNEMPMARNAVDKVVAMMSQGLFSTGPGSQRVAAYGRDLLDLGSIRTYLAHLARDAFVCGNGYLSFGAVPDEDIRLLPPEQVTILGPDVMEIEESGVRTVYRNVLHDTGAEQWGSSYGVSVLEPFVRILTQKEGLEAVRSSNAEWDQLGISEHQRRQAKEVVAMAGRSLQDLDQQAAQLLGGSVAMAVAPPSDLYFPGYELMAPAADVYQGRLAR